MSNKIEFGDFQTPKEFAFSASQLIKDLAGNVEHIIEPTCGLGNFIDAANKVWKVPIDGFEINENYYFETRSKFLNEKQIEIHKQDFFEYDWKSLLFGDHNILVLGNPPWVTNSKLGSLNSKNLPQKDNFQKMRGFDAKTGKANFDIAEWMIIELVKSLPFSGKLGMLCKTSTARKVLQHFWKTRISINNVKLFMFDSKKIFDVNVDSCLLYLERTANPSFEAELYKELQLMSKPVRFGIINNNMISNIDNYSKYQQLDGFSNYNWRSGLKHDASKVMELSRKEDSYTNGFNETVKIEDSLVYPLLKSSDIGNGRINPRKFVIVTQKSIGEDTSSIKTTAPKTWDYLEKHQDILAERKSSIYKNKPRYSIFGIGEYSFTEWKVAISGLYKNLKFTAIPPVNGKPQMLDDTCYLLPCKSKTEAVFWEKLLNSKICMDFLSSLIFFDAKRPVTVDILKRIDLKELARLNNEEETASEYLSKPFTGEKISQGMFVFENENKYELEKLKA